LLRKARSCRSRCSLGTTPSLGTIKDLGLPGSCCFCGSQPWWSYRPHRVKPMLIRRAEPLRRGLFQSVAARLQRNCWSPPASHSLPVVVGCSIRLTPS